MIFPLPFDFSTTTQTWLINAKVLPHPGHRVVSNEHPLQPLGDDGGLGTHYTMTFYDSKHDDGDEYLGVLKTIYQRLLKHTPSVYNKHRVEHGVSLNARMSICPAFPKPPKQASDDDNNCGAFMCAHAHCVLQMLPTGSFTPVHMDRLFRKHMCYSILQQKLQNVIECPKLNIRLLEEFNR